MGATLSALDLTECAGCTDEERVKSSPLGSKKTAFGSMSSTSMLEHRPTGEFVIFLHRAEDIPTTPEGRCYVDLHLESSSGAFVSPLFRTSLCSGGNGRPVWSCYITFHVQPHDDDILVTRIYEQSMFRDDLLGTVRTTISDVRQRRVVEAEDHQHAGGAAGGGRGGGGGGGGGGGRLPTRPTFPRMIDLSPKIDPNLIMSAKIYFSCPSFQHERRTRNDTSKKIKNKKNTSTSTVGDDVSFEVVKDFFLIRHGESEWNEAKRNGNLLGLAGSYDHPLNLEGMKQAMELQRRWSSEGSENGEDGWWEAVKKKAEHQELARKFEQVETVLSSPMTRAVQTALLACRNHPTLMQLPTTTNPMWKRAAAATEAEAETEEEEEEEEEEETEESTRSQQYPITLLRCLRERKGGIGSFDCVGKRIGENIVNYAKEHIVTLMERSNGTEQMEKEKQKKDTFASFECNDCDNEWWTSSTSADTEVRQIQYSKVR